MTTFTLDNYNVVTSQEQETYNSIRLKYEKLARSLESKFDREYSANFSDIDSLHENCSSIFYSQYLNEAIEQAIADLVTYNIFDVNESVFMDKYLSDHFTWGDDWEEIDKQYLEIVLNAKELDDYRASRREGRGKWVGGGFGLSGAVKGSLQAGAINLAAGAAHGAFNLAAKGFSMVGDTIKKEKLFNNPKTKENLTLAVYMQIYFVHYAVVSAITDKSSTKIYMPSSHDIDSAKSILENIQKNRVTADKVKELLAKAIALNPYNSSLYECWFEKYMDASGQLERIACFFGEDTITIKKIKILDSFKASLSFSSPKDAQISWAKFENKAKEIGKPFSDEDIIDEKRLILDSYMNSLDFSTAPETEKNLPSLKTYAEAIDFLDEYQRKKAEIEQSLVQKALDLKVADTLTNSTKQIALLIITYVLFLLFASMITAAIADKNIVFGLFSAGVVYACYTKISSVKGTRATKILHNLAHISIGFFTFAFGISLTAFLEPEKGSVFASLVMLALAGGVGWNFYNIAVTRFKEQGMTPKPQKFITAAVSGLIISSVVGGYLFYTNKNTPVTDSAASTPLESVQVESTVVASTPNNELPFIGERSFNFMGGRGTENSITIAENGDTTVTSIGTESSSVDYQGKFTNPILLSHGGGLLFKNGQVYATTNGQIDKDCMGDGQECVSELYNSAQEQPAVVTSSPPSIELPFVGKRSFDFSVAFASGEHTGNDNIITINANGHTIVDYQGSGEAPIQYEGSFSNPLLLDDGRRLVFKEGKVYGINNSEYKMSCYVEECSSNLYVIE